MTFNNPKPPSLRFPVSPALGLAIHPDRVEAYQPSSSGEAKYLEFGIPEGWVDPNTAMVLEPQALGKELKRQLRSNRFWQKKAFVGIDGAIVRQIHLPLPYIPEKEELKVAITTEAERYAMFSESEAVVDLLALGQENNGVRVLFAAIRKDVSQSYEKALRSAGLNLLALEPLSMSCLRSLLDHEKEQRDHLGVLAWGERALSISTWRQGSLQVWREIERSNIEEANDLALEILRTVGGDRPPEWLVFSPEKKEYLAERLEAEIEWVDAEKETKIFAAGASLDGQENQDFSLPKFDLRFVEPIKGTIISRKQAVFISCAVFYLIGMLSWRFVLEHRLNALGLEIEQTNRRLALLQSVEAAPSDPLEVARQKGISEYRDGIEMIRKFRRIREIMPADAWFTQLTIGAEQELSLDGYAMSQRSPLSFALALNREGFGQITPPLLKKEEIEGEKVFHFTLNGISAKGSAE